MRWQRRNDEFLLAFTLMLKIMIIGNLLSAGFIAIRVVGLTKAGKE